MSEIRRSIDESLLPFARTATIQTEEDLKYGAQSLMRHVDKELDDEDRRRVHISIQELVVKDIELSLDNTSDVVEILQTPSTTHGNELVRASVESVARKVLIGKGSKGRGNRRFSEERFGRLKGARVANAILAYDNAGLIGDTFWADFATVSEGALRVPQFLPVLHAKLTQDEAFSLAECIPEYRHAGRLTAQRYLARVIKSYLRDTNRKNETIARLYEVSGTGETRSPLLRRAPLIDAANGALGRYVFSQETTDLGELARQFDVLRLPKTATLADAFFRAASSFHGAYSPPYLRTQQLRQDKYHAEIAAVLHAGEPIPIEIEDIDVAMRFSDVGPEKLAAVQELTMNGEAIVGALYKVFAPKSDLSDSIDFS